MKNVKRRMLLPFLMAQTVICANCGAGWQPQLVGREMHKLDCFDISYSQREKPASCEPSAVVMDGNKAIMASDKDMPGQPSSLMVVDENGQMQGTLDSELLNRMQKIEALSRTPDHKWLVASSAFSYYQPEEAKYNRHSMLVVWPAGKPEAAQLLFPKLVDGEESSIALNDAMRAALVSEKWPKGPPYFKIEGMTIAPDNKILVGVREQGATWEDFEYSRTVLAMDYTIVDGKWEVSGKFSRVADFNLPSALSDLAYDEKHDVLYVLTSFEGAECSWSVTENHLGGILYWLPYSDLGKKDPRAIGGTDNLKFAHKSEGVAVMADGNLLVVHDDDRDLGINPEEQRTLNQCFYEIIKLK